MKIKFFLDEQAVSVQQYAKAEVASRIIQLFCLILRVNAKERLFCLLDIDSERFVRT